MHTVIHSIHKSITENLKRFIDVS